MRFCDLPGIVSETFHPPATSTPLTSCSSHDELLEPLKTQLAMPLYTAIRSKLDGYESKLQYAELKIQLLEERLRKHRIAKYGPSSEKLSGQQLELLELEPGAVLRAGDQAREACLQVMRRTWRRCSAAAAADHREEPRQRSRDHRHGGESILRSQSALSSERDSVARCWPRDQPGDAGWLGDACGASYSHPWWESWAASYFVALAFRPTRLRSACGWAMAAARIIRLICGNTELREARRSSSSASSPCSWQCR